jgi:hypothetical protein
MAIQYTKPAAWESFQRVLPEGYRPIKTSEALADVAILKEARKFIDKNVKANMPLGTREYKTVNGKALLFTIEPHYHEPNGPTKPWGWHKGASVSINPNPKPVQAQNSGYANPYRPQNMTAISGERFDHFTAALKSFPLKARKFILRY